MTATIDGREIALRLALTVLAGGLLGFNRSEHGMAAGLRTTLLVCLAAAASMIQVNILLTTVGKAPDSFVMMDLMRLPLGILTGMGFIGAGAIMRRGDRVQGVTTAATLWLATVLGLCFGGGQHVLGLATLALGVVILWFFKWLELCFKQERRAVLTVVLGADGPGDDEIRNGLQSAGYRLSTWDGAFHRGVAGKRRIRSEVHWHSRAVDAQTPDYIRGLAARAGVHAVRWQV